MRQLFILIILVLITQTATARLIPQGLTVHGVEVGVAKFHRYDNKVHAYPTASAWTYYTAPANYVASMDPFVIPQQDGSVTIIFSNLEDLLMTANTLAKSKGVKIKELNIHTHGLPGGLWFPMDRKTLASFECADWRRAAEGKDDANYKQYYSPINKGDILAIRQMSQQNTVNYSCTTGARQFQTIAERHSELKEAFAPGASINMLACVVGLGRAGEMFAGQLANLFLADRKGFVQAGFSFGMGDWSMPEGMGFWDYINDQQLAKDNALYSKNKTDREIHQKGVIRVTSFEKGQALNQFLQNQEFMFFGKNLMALPSLQGVPAKITTFDYTPRVPAPAVVRVPGTSYRVYRK